MEELKKQSPIILERTDKIDIEVAKNYPKIVDGFNSLYVEAKKHEPTLQALQDTFEACETDEERLALSDTALEIVRTIKPLKGKNGAVNTKARYKQEPLKITRLIDGSYNVVVSLVDEMLSKAEPIAKYKDIIEAKHKEALHNERVEQIKILGGENLLYKYPAGFGEFTSEQFDIVLEDIHSLLESERLKQAEAKRLADIEANKATIRNMRKNQLATVGYSYDGDEADISEVEFMQVLKDATEAKKQAEAKRLGDIEAKRLAEEKAEMQRLEAIKSAGDADKFKALVDKAKELAIYAEGFEMDSEKGKICLTWFTSNINSLSAKSYEAYNKLR